MNRKIVPTSDWEAKAMPCNPWKFCFISVNKVWLIERGAKFKYFNHKESRFIRLPAYFACSDKRQLNSLITSHTTKTITTWKLSFPHDSNEDGTQTTKNKIAHWSGTVWVNTMRKVYFFLGCRLKRLILPNSISI